MRLAMSADNSCASHHRGHNDVISVVAPACVPDATGQFPGVHARIDAGRACLVMSPFGADPEQ